jgi:hypothetical protein
MAPSKLHMEKIVATQDASQAVADQDNLAIAPPAKRTPEELLIQPRR